MSENIWNEEVEYVDLNASNLEPSPTSRTLPLFLLGKHWVSQKKYSQQLSLISVKKK